MLIKEKNISDNLLVYCKNKFWEDTLIRDI